MAIEYAAKYASKIDERFKLSSVTTPMINNDFDFIGVKTVKVYSVPTAEMNDYQRSGSSRYGTPTELENNIQEMTLTRDRSFTFTIDKGNYDDTMMLNSAGKALQRQIDEVIVPETDIYRIATACAMAGTIATGAITKDSAYEAFLDGTTALTNKKVPKASRIAYVSASFYKLIKLDTSFIKNSEIAQNALVKDQIGMVDGIPLVLVPDSYLPTGVSFMITSPIATVAPVRKKFKKYKRQYGIYI